MVGREDDVEEEADLHQQVLDRGRIADAEHPPDHIDPRRQGPASEREHELPAREERETDHRTARERDGRGDRRPGHPERRQTETAEDEHVRQQHVDDADHEPDQEWCARVPRTPEARDHHEEGCAGRHSEHHDAQEGHADGYHLGLDVERAHERGCPCPDGHDRQQRQGHRREDRLAKGLLGGAQVPSADLAGHDRERARSHREHDRIYAAEDLHPHADAGDRARTEAADHEHVAEPDEGLDRKREDHRPGKCPRRVLEVACGPGSPGRGIDGAGGSGVCARRHRRGCRNHPACGQGAALPRSSIELARATRGARRRRRRRRGP